MIKLDPRSSTPIYEQIELGIKELILKGALAPGDKLLSVREMSSILTTNPNTVSKAYGSLEREGVIETLRGRGTFVSADYKGKADEKKLEQIGNDLKKIILEANYSGLSKEDFLDLVIKTFTELGVNNNDIHK